MGGLFFLFLDKEGEDEGREGICLYLYSKLALESELDLGFWVLVLCVLLGGFS